jgi:hypothetical protein
LKKYPLILFVVIILLFSGCQPNPIKEKKTDVSSFFNNINASFSARFGELETEGIFTYTPERLTLEFVSPRTVNGLKITVESSSLTLSINDLSVKRENNKITRQFNAFAVFSALNSARLTGMLNKTDGRTAITGEGFEITLDTENRISEISIPEKDIFIKLEW